MNPLYEAMLERLRRAKVPEELIQAIWHDDRFGHDVRSDQNVVDGLIECYRRGMVHIDSDGVLRFTETGQRAVEAAERRRRIGDPAETPMHAIKVTPELARRLNATFPRMRRVADDVLHVSDDVLARIKKHQRPGETESAVIGRFLDVYRDAQLEDLMRGIS